MTKTMMKLWPSPSLRLLVRGHLRPFLIPSVGDLIVKAAQRKGHAVGDQVDSPGRRPFFFCRRLLGPSPLLHYLPSRARHNAENKLSDGCMKTQGTEVLNDWPEHW